MPFLLWSLHLFLRGKHGQASFIAGIAANLHILLAIYVLAMFLTSTFIQNFLFDRDETWLKRGLSCGKKLIKHGVIFCIAASPVIIWVLSSFHGAFGATNIHEWSRLIRMHYGVHLSAFSWTRTWIAFSGFILLWFISFKYKPAKDKHRIICSFALAVLILCVTAVVFNEVIPSVSIMKLQLFRCTIFFIILAFPYICNYLWQSWKNGQLQRVAVFCCLVGFAMWSNKIIWLVILVFVATHYGLIRNRIFEFAFSMGLLLLVLGLALMSGKGGSPEVPFFIRAVVFVPLFLFFLSTCFKFSKYERFIHSNSILFNLAIVLVVLSFFSIYTRISTPGKKADDWKAVQVWCKENTSKDALFVVPPYMSVYVPDFRVWSERSTFVNEKDGDIVFANAQIAMEWWRRMQELGYSESNYHRENDEEIYRGLDEARYQEIARKYGANYAVVEQPNHLKLSPIYSNRSFAVVDIVSSVHKQAGPWCIVRGQQADAMEQLAASELQRYLQQMTGQAFPLLVESDAPPTGNVFLIGKPGNHRLLRAFRDRKLITLNADKLGPEGFIQITMEDGGRHYVVLAAIGDLGIQYAVYDFLETICHVGFFLDGDQVPRVKSLEVPDLDVTKKPFCAFRSQSVYGKGKLWYGNGTWPGLITFEQDGYRTGWRDFIDWMVKKKENLLYLKRGFFNIGYLEGFPELNTPADRQSIEADGYWFTLDFTADAAQQLISYARSRGLKICYTATLCRVPSCFKRLIEDPRHPLFGLKYEDMGSWLRLDPLDDRTYTYCLRGQAEAIVRRFGKPDFWYGYYGWSERPMTMGLTRRSMCHYKAYDLVFRKMGGPLLVYTWDWGGPGGPSLADEWAHFKRVMPRDGSVILAVNHGAEPFLRDPAGPFAGYPWWQYLTSTADDQGLPEEFFSLGKSYKDWQLLLRTGGANSPQGFGLDNMIHHVDQRLTDFECSQGFSPTADRQPLEAFLADYVVRAYGRGPWSADLLKVHVLWSKQRRLTLDQVEQLMVPYWPGLADNLIFRTDLTEALCYTASDKNRCALLVDKWIYSTEFTKKWARQHIPLDAWTPGGTHLWEQVLSFPSRMTYENVAKLLSGVEPGTLTVKVTDAKGKLLTDRPVIVKRGGLTRIKAPAEQKLQTNVNGLAQMELMPDVYEISVVGSQVTTPVLMLHGRSKKLVIIVP